MNITKIKNYNQKIFAILGTVIVLIAIIGLVLITIFAIEEIGRSHRYNNQDDGILSDERIEELQKENKRKQLISYETPKLVDSLNMVYIIPVSHKTLKISEDIEEQALCLMEPSGSYKTNNRYSNQYYGNYNNLLIYDYKKNDITKLFSDRVNFENIQTIYYEDDILVFFKASTKDTYRDGVINQLDFRSLFIYSLGNKNTQEIKLENADVRELNFVGDSKNLIIRFGIDHNGDGKFDRYSEPSLIKKYNYKSHELVDIISDSLNIELQHKLEGTK